MKFNTLIKSISPSTSMVKGLNQADIKYNLAMGAPDIHPPDEVFDIIRNYSRNPVFRYLPSKGSIKALSNLRQIVLDDSVSIDPAINCVLVPGAKYGIYLTLKSVCNSGDSVLLIEPYWLSYPEICKSLGLIYQTVDVDPKTARYSVASIKARLKEHQCGAIILNNPVNPSGYIFTEDELSEIIEFCKERNVWVIIDEVYKNLCFDRSLILHKDLSDAHVIRVGSLSKSLNLPGFRAGYVVGEKSFINLFDRVHQHIATCIHPLTDEIISHISASAFQTFSSHCAEIYSGRYELAKSMLVSKGFTILESKASFYLMVDVSGKFTNGNEAADYYERLGISVTPGENYGNSYRNFIRLCLTLPKEDLIKVLNLL